MTDAQHTDRADDAGLSAEESNLRLEWAIGALLMVMNCSEDDVLECAQAGLDLARADEDALREAGNHDALESLAAARTAALTTPAGGAETSAEALHEAQRIRLEAAEGFMNRVLDRKGVDGWTLQGSIYEGYSTEIWANDAEPGKRSIAQVRDYHDAQKIMAALAQPAAPATGATEALTWGAYARAACEAEGRNWVALDNTPEDCDRWFAIGRACAARSASGPTPDASAELTRLRKVERLARELELEAYPAHGSGFMGVLVEGSWEDLQRALGKRPGIRPMGDAGGEEAAA